MRRSARLALILFTAAALASPALAQDARAEPKAWLGVTLGAVEAEPTGSPDGFLDGPAGEGVTGIPRGARVTGVVSDSPAARAGLRAGDVVLAADGQPVGSPSELVSAVGASDPGTWVELRIVRRGEERSLTARLIERPELGRQLDVRRAWAGLTLVDVPRQLQEAWGGEEGSGVLVGAVEPGSPAEIGGVLPGDLVLAIDGRPVRGSFELMPRLRGGGVGNEIRLEISRQGTLLDVSVELIEQPPRQRRDRREPRRRSRLGERRDGTHVDADGFIASENFLTTGDIEVIDELPDGQRIVIIETPNDASPPDDDER